MGVTGLGINTASAVTLTRLAAFNGTTQGSAPQAGLIADAAGNLYGTTTMGGANGKGTIFRLSPTGTLTTLASLSDASGWNCEATLARDAAGNLYGATYFGGANMSGAVFKLTSSGTLSTLANFSNASGGYARAGVVIDPEGNLLGAAGNLGANNRGTLYKVTPGGAISAVVNFNMLNGATPIADMLAAADGNYYGTTSAGGTVNVSDHGTIFKLTPSGTFTTLANFNGDNGATPWAGLVEDSVGNLYGTS
jgi:uncharacterized repeat protein (TIGR03803 family)